MFTNVHPESPGVGSSTMEDDEDIRSIMHNYARRSSGEYPEVFNYPESPEPSQALNDLTLQRFMKETLRRLTAVEAAVQENMASIRTASVSLERFGKKMDESARKAELLQTKVVALERNNAVLRERCHDLDAYKRRWNLRVLGIQERHGENVKQMIVDLFSAVSPDIADQLPHGIDLAHRLGPRSEQPRCVVVQFTERSHRGKIWRAAATSELLKQLNIQIIEDLSEGGGNEPGNQPTRVAQAQTSLSRAHDNRTGHVKEENQEFSVMDHVVAVKVEKDADCRYNDDKEERNDHDDIDKDDDSEDEDDEDSDDDEETDDASEEDEAEEQRKDPGSGTRFGNISIKSEDPGEERNDYDGSQRQQIYNARAAPHNRHLGPRLKPHKKWQTGVKKPYQCSVCGNGFVTERNLMQHHRIHTGEKPHPCPYCGKRFRHIQTLIKHRKIHTREKPHQCSQCGKSFAQTICLKAHQRIHTGEKPYSCAECGKSFTQEKFLKNHTKIHSREKLHTCLYCGKDFTFSGNLKNHMRIHTGEKPYHCTDCGKSFTHAATFISHHRIHTGEKPYRCTDCGKSFTHSTTLKNHQRTHTGERPYHCTLCGKSYTQLGVLREHQRSCHMEER